MCCMMFDFHLYFLISGLCKLARPPSDYQFPCRQIEPRFLLFWFQSFDFLQLSFGVSVVPLLKRRKSRSFVSIMAIELLGPERKVVVHLRATGDAPILKKAKFKTAGTNKFSTVIEFLRHQLHRDTLFVYVNSAFSPNPDELMIDLYNVANPSTLPNPSLFLQCIVLRQLIVLFPIDLSVTLFSSSVDCSHPWTCNGLHYPTDDEKEASPF
ncbi:hypothetical protein HPP92_019155 [Vanilla planifolia]|uniref:Ubiquitin-like protein ATG12 n=1 Tax=Vanilla planifolia TaxID=51239 RepID=A0A835UP29_VANPL|nr:hypothetical protein HPP92_019155 [Vanilla planifolia]